MLFIIGNGFDLAMGLKTSYRDFVNWYLTQTEKPEDARIAQFKNKIQSDIETDINSWADLEIKLGEYTAQYKEDEADDFLFVYRNMKEKLNDYIKIQESTADVSDEEIVRKELSRFVLSFYDEFPTNTKKTFREILYGHNGSVTYNFISYNYTHTFENCLNLMPKPLRKRGGNKQYSDNIGRVLHLHGEIDNSPLIGVDSDSQIANETFRIDVRVLRALVKPRINDEMQENIVSTALELINSGNVICIFGVSLGDSDISWWKKIGEWLKSNGGRRLVIFWYSNEPLSPLHYDIKLTREDSIKRHFSKQAGLTEAEYTQVENRITVHIYRKYFDMELRKKEPQ